MAKLRTDLSAALDRSFLTDGGLETTLIFHEGFDLPYFAAFTLLNDETGREALRRYYRSYARTAIGLRVGFLLESPTWRANSDWGKKLGLSEKDLERYNHSSIEFLEELRAEFESSDAPVLISGCVGPQDDGYQPETLMNAIDAERYHSSQIKSLNETTVDMISAFTMTYINEAIGIVRAAQTVDIPVVISFTVETDGKLPDGTSLERAINEVDLETNGGPVYYMINCAHPSHFNNELRIDNSWRTRIRGIRANASLLSHAELDESISLDEGDPDGLASDYAELMELLPNLTVFGGCCGTDHRHVAKIGEVCLSGSQSR